MHKQLEGYLDQVEVQLYSMPGEERDNEMLEIRQHIQALADTLMENGASEDDAIAVAIRQFGDPAQVGRELWLASPHRPANITDEIRRAFTPRYRETWLQVVTVFSVMAVPTLLVLLVMVPRHIEELANFKVELSAPMMVLITLSKFAGSPLGLLFTLFTLALLTAGVCRIQQGIKVRV